MKDSWCKPYTAVGGQRVSGAAAREARIADQGGIDQMTTKREIRGFKSGYSACKEDMADRLDAVEARLTHLEKLNFNSRLFAWTCQEFCVLRPLG